MLDVTNNFLLELRNTLLYEPYTPMAHVEDVRSKRTNVYFSYLIKYTYLLLNTCRGNTV